MRISAVPPTSSEPFCPKARKRRSRKICAWPFSSPVMCAAHHCTKSANKVSRVCPASPLVVMCRRHDSRAAGAAKVQRRLVRSPRGGYNSFMAIRHGLAGQYGKSQAQRRVGVLIGVLCTLAGIFGFAAGLVFQNMWGPRSLAVVLGVPLAAGLLMLAYKRWGE